MLKHLVLWTLTEKARAEGLSQAVSRLGDSARNMVGKIPGLLASEVYLNKAAPGVAADDPGAGMALGSAAADSTQAPPDAHDAEEFRNLVFYSEFESPAALAAYQEHPLHRAHREMAASYVRNRETVDFEV
ncbi:MAG: Dabb family protein [Spirochaetaceae bacterium]|jgi:hypothetical protein|nr:Dabb family protein [Spirochaetaceae bacterium]